jgi:NAD(P)-dependent dehydrogenase (short-subunit alcohol dehydrogenase family)
MSDFNGKVVLITGAGRGAGRALAEAFAARGARVAANDISPVNVEAVVREINQRGGTAKAYIEDIAKKVGAQALIKNVEDDLGSIDILVNHAAVEPHGPLLEMDEWDWHRTLDVNLTGAFLMLQSVGRTMRARGRGAIINIVPAAGRGVREEAGAYRASMAGLVELSREAEKELRRFGIHVHAVNNTERVVDEVISLCLSMTTQMEEK